MNTKTLQTTLRIIAVVQFVLGTVLLIPGLFASVLGLAAAPGWVDWMLSMTAARAIGFGYGMLLAAREPRRHLAWIRAMVGIQAIDWLATVAYLVAGTVTIGQVTTAAFLPVVFIGLLVRLAPRSSADEARTAVSA